MTAPLVLSLETSTPVLSCALLERSPGGLRLLGLRSVAPPAVVSTLVPGLFDTLLTEAGASSADLGAVVTGLGPGLFTGARVAVATMKAVAYARKIPLLGAGSLEALALSAARGRALEPGEETSFDEPLTSGWICPVIDARKGEVYLSVQRWTGGQIEVRTPPRSATPAEARETLEERGPVVAAGAGLRAAGLDQAGPLYPCAADTAFLALQRDRAPRFDAAAILAVEPAYIRPPEAEVARQRRIAVGR